ncbi:pyridoxal phosphate-dependent aminotransferase [Tundrisphaera sp. TA3]|uniref:pyridoxal phosphate-dependent aminotransferase n=1 Tax=Tundrisphaera sp. TA3 TaxID=3435775 RepID=UPI003EBD3BDF
MANLSRDHNDPSSIRRRFGLGADAPLLDFSSNLNPLGPPTAALEAARAAVDRVGIRADRDCPRLVDRIAEEHGVPADRVIVGAGASELIGLIGQSLREVLALHAQSLGDPGRALSHQVDPTDAAYRRVARLNEMRAQVWGTHVLGWAQDVLPRGAAGIFWTGHPNNPTGRAWDRATLEAFVAESLALLTVVDETSLPFLADAADRTLIPVAAERENVMVLRSFTRAFALPGLRVGYAIAPPDMVTRLRQYQEAWTVSAPAEAAALAALDDRAYQERTVELVGREAERLADRLWDIPGLRPAWPDRIRPDRAPGLANFLLVSLAQTDWTSIQLQEALARRGLLVRECSDFPGLEVGALLTGPDQLVATQGHLRIGVRMPDDNGRLADALAELLASGPPIG